MSLHKEVHLEEEICLSLAGRGWVYELGVSAQYDRAHAFFPEDTIAWVRQTNPKAWSALEKGFAGKSADVLLDRLRSQLDTRGTLDVLRNGIEIHPVRGTLHLVQFKPASGMNPDLTAKYNANRLRVVRQVKYSLGNENCIDLVLFVNGIPVATAELKSDFTQSVEDAVDAALAGHIVHRAPGLDLFQRSDNLRFRMPAPAHVLPTPLPEILISSVRIQGSRSASGLRRPRSGKTTTVCPLGSDETKRDRTKVSNGPPDISDPGPLV